MLDNLKLGYGGTKTEMERLIADAAKLDSSIKANDLSFGNIVKAINAVQTELGITGATALEAGTTIEGSVNSMKSAWSNLITGLADENANISELVNSLVITIVGDGTESNLGVFGNILPAIKTALTGASTLISELFPKIMQEIPTIINENLPILATAAVSIVESLVNGISENQEMLTKTALETITFLTKSLLEMLPEIVALGLELIISLAEGIADSLPELVPTIIEVIGEIVDTLTDPTNLKTLLSAALEIITELAYGLVDAIPELVDAVIDIIIGLQSFLTDPENLAKIIKAALDIVIALAGGLIAAIPELIAGVVEMITALTNRFKETDWAQVGQDLIDGVLNGLKRAWESVKTWFTNAWNSLFGGRSVEVNANVNSASTDGSHYSGIDYVPADNYIARLHRGERVLTREENLDYNNGSGRTVNVIQNIYSEAKTAADLIQEAVYQQERAVLIGV
jgi:phage-related protein